VLFTRNILDCFQLRFRSLGGGTIPQIELDATLIENIRLYFYAELKIGRLPFIGDDLEATSISYLDAFLKLSKAVINGIGLSLSAPS
jgi:hypothetical protein